MKPLKVNPEYFSMIPRHTKEEREALERSIIESKGPIDPIEINKNDEILDGHTRFEICNKNSTGHVLFFETKVVDLPTPLDEKIYIITKNLFRRQLTDFQKIELAKPLEELFAEKAKIRQNAGTLTSNEAKGSTTELTAKAIGVSKATYERGKKIRDKGTEQEKAKARQKPRAINSAYRDVVKRTKVEELSNKGVPPLPEGQYGIILADPPYDYELQLRGEPGLHYPTMKTEDICALKVPAADNCILFLWATNPKLHEALEVMRSWGFHYVTDLAWVKDKIGTGYWFRGQHELLLVGRKGKVSPPPEWARRSSVLEAPRREHSQKPDEVYSIIEQYYPGATYLELFARGSARAGWVKWGDGVTPKSLTEPNSLKREPEFNQEVEEKSKRSTSGA